MAVLSLDAAFEPLEIVVNGKELDVRIDMRNDNLLRIARSEREFAAVGKKHLEPYKKAVEDGNGDEARRLSAKLAKAVEPCVQEAIGEDAYAALLEALGSGTPVKAADVPIQLCLVWMEVCKACKRRTDAIEDKKSHYLAAVKGEEA